MIELVYLYSHNVFFKIFFNYFDIMIKKNKKNKNIFLIYFLKNLQHA